MPGVSVVIPAYQAAGWVGRAIESVLKQTRPADEILVVDDGSTDRTAEIAGAMSPIVRVVRRVNGGPGAARNTGIRLSQGDWIALLDADDVWLPHKLERQLPYSLDPKTAIIHAGMIGRAVPTPDLISFQDLWDRNHIVASSVLLRKACFEAIGGFDERRSLVGVEDYNLWLRIAAAGWRIVSCQEPLVQYLPAPGNLSSRPVTFIDAELANIAAVAEQLGIPKSEAQEQHVRVLARYAEQFLVQRQLEAARVVYGRLLRLRPGLTPLFGFGAACLPRLVLDAGRRWRRRWIGEQGTPNPDPGAAKSAG